MIPFCLPDILQNSSDRYPTKVAVISDNKRLSYEQLNAKVIETASTLHYLGVGKGDPVVISMVNSIEFIVAFFAIAKVGGIIVPVNPDLSLREFQYILGHCEAKVLITVSENRSLLEDILPSTVGSQIVVLLDDDPERARENLLMERSLLSRVSFSKEITNNNTDMKPVHLIDIDDAMIIYTSGTSGLPKGVLLSHLNIMSSIRSVVEFLRLTPDETALVCLPSFHIYTLSQLLTHLICGGRVVLLENFLFPTQALRLIEQEHVTGLGGSPATFSLLLNVKDLANYQLSSLRYLLNSGGPLSQQTLLQLMEAFPQAEIISAYGLTEAASRVSHCVYKKGSTRRLGSVGRAIPNVEVRVVNAAGGDVKPGEVGEIVVRGSTVMKGYFRDEVATARILTSDGLHTGDFGFIDDDGCLFIVGRRDDILNSGGESISAKELEDVLLSHPAISEAAVVGKPDHIMGEAIQAFLVMRPGLTVSIDDVKEHCLTHLSRYKVPRDFIVCATLPKTPSGKIQKHLLRDSLTNDLSS